MPNTQIGVKITALLETHVRAKHEIVALDQLPDMFNSRSSREEHPFGRTAQNFAASPATRATADGNSRVTRGDYQSCLAAAVTAA